MNGTASSDSLTSTTAQATITIRDVNDSPPSFNKKEYEVSLQENTAPGTPLPLDMNVTDHDVGINSKFSLRLDDVSGVFEVEPKYVNGFSQVNIRVGNGTLDYENPNQRKFIVLVIAEETDTKPKLSSTATITITVLDANDNKPMFEISKKRCGDNLRLKDVLVSGLANHELWYAVLEQIYVCFNASRKWECIRHFNKFTVLIS